MIMQAENEISLAGSAARTICQHVQEGGGHNAAPIP